MWKSIDAGPLDAGDVGGDIQRGAAWSRRFVWSDDNGRLLPVGQTESIPGAVPVYAVIDENWYAVDVKETNEDDDETPVYDVQNQTCFILCTDPDNAGNTEEWSDYQYEFANDIGFTTLEDANSEARACAANAAAFLAAHPSIYGPPENWH